jgi:hypothetical protein
MSNVVPLFQGVSAAQRRQEPLLTQDDFVFLHYVHERVSAVLRANANNLLYVGYTVEDHACLAKYLQEENFSDLRRASKLLHALSVHYADAADRCPPESSERFMAQAISGQMTDFSRTLYPSHEDAKLFAFPRP